MMPMPFNFAWAVQDAPSANDYEQKASSDGETVTGSYRVALPDGRTQIVTYTADSNGYVAQVTYEGEAKYPEQKSLSSASAYDQSAYRPSSSDQNQSYWSLCPFIDFFCDNHFYPNAIYFFII